MIIEVARIFLKKSPQLVVLQCPEGTCVAQALESSGLIPSEVCLTDLSMGIFGVCVSLHHVLSPGDRLEVYEALVMDPKQARMLRVQR